MIAEALGRLLAVLFPALLLPDLRVGAVLAAVAALAIVAVITILIGASGSAAAVAWRTGAFAAVRCRLRASNPDAAGHRRARAPGATR